jgi:peptide deformylase
MGYSREYDFTSIIFQHEFDHLNGVLFTDKIYTSSDKETGADQFEEAE